MAEKKTVKARVIRDFLERVYPGEEIMVSPARAALLEEEGRIEILPDPKPARSSGKGKDSKETEKKSSD